MDHIPKKITSGKNSKPSLFPSTNWPPTQKQPPQQQLTQLKDLTASPQVKKEYEKEQALPVPTAKYVPAKKSTSFTRNVPCLPCLFWQPQCEGRKGEKNKKPFFLRKGGKCRQEFYVVQHQEEAIRDAAGMWKNGLLFLSLLLDLFLLDAPSLAGYMNAPW